MASKRQLKKRISYVCGDLASEILTASEIIDGIDPADVNRIICRIAALQVHARDMVSVDFDKVPRDFESGRLYNNARHAYYKKAFASLRDEFASKVIDIVKDMNALIPADQRDKLKSIG